MKNIDHKYHVSNTDLLLEVELIRRAQTDVNQFAPLYNKYYFRVLSFIYRKVESRDIADEATAQTFYKALENLHKYEYKGLPFSSWLFRIASNELNQLFRKNKVRRTVSIDDEAVKSLEIEIDEQNNDGKKQRLKDALQSLSLEELEIVDLRYFENRSFSEVCEITGLKESAAKMRMHRALKKLKERFKETE